MVELIALWCHRKAAQNVKFSLPFLLLFFISSLFVQIPPNTLLGRKMNFTVECGGTLYRIRENGPHQSSTQIAIKTHCDPTKTRREKEAERARDERILNEPNVKMDIGIDDENIILTNTRNTYLSLSENSFE